MAAGKLPHLFPGAARPSHSLGHSSPSVCGWFGHWCKPGRAAADLRPNCGRGFVPDGRGSLDAFSHLVAGWLTAVEIIRMPRLYVWVAAGPNHDSKIYRRSLGEIVDTIFLVILKIFHIMFGKIIKRLWAWLTQNFNGRLECGSELFNKQPHSKASIFCWSVVDGVNWKPYYGGTIQQYPPKSE